jgi:hypothetical protein
MLPARKQQKDKKEGQERRRKKEKKRRRKGDNGDDPVVLELFGKVGIPFTAASIRLEPNNPGRGRRGRAKVPDLRKPWTARQ